MNRVAWRRVCTRKHCTYSSRLASCVAIGVVWPHNPSWPQHTDEKFHSVAACQADCPPSPLHSSAPLDMAAVIGYLQHPCRPAFW